MESIWKNLYGRALEAISPRDISNNISVGCVAAAVLTKKGTIYTGICIDTSCSLGICAERNALFHMLASGEDEAAKIVSVYKDGTVLPPCGACREFMMQLGADSGNIEIMLDQHGSFKKLKDLLPESTYGCK